MNKSDFFIKHEKAFVALLVAFVAIFVTSTFVFLDRNVGEEGRVYSPKTLDNALLSLDVMETLNFTEDNSVFFNPEKGFYREVNTSSMGTLSNFKSQNLSLVLIETNLSAFKTGPISDAKLTEISNAFSLARQNGLKVIFRAAYDFDGVVAPEPSDINILLNHINQLKPIFTANEDVIYCVQAGFIGSWGEWHSTIYGSTPYKYNSIPLDVRKEVVSALLAAVPKSRMIQIREPRYIRDMYANTPGGNVLTDATAFNGSDLARTGFHDDGMLYDANDNGTFGLEAGYDRNAELNWANVQMKYTPFGGESDGLSSYSDPDVVMPYLEKLHAQFLNIEYYPSVINKWKTTTYNGENTFNYISEKLGYKYLLTSAKISSKVYVGGVMHIDLNIQNKGFGGLINPRTFEIVLSNGTDTYKATVNDDPRKWYKENGVMDKDLYFLIPSNIKPGTWNVYINLPDASSSLKNNPNYSIRLANTGVWNPATGYNLLKSGIVIDDIGLTSTNITFEQTSRSYAEKVMGLDIGVPVTSVSVTPKTLTLELGASANLSATVLPDNATEKSVTYTSSNPSVATVDSNGKVVAISSGAATITITTLSEAKTTTCGVTVNKPAPVVIPVTGVTLSPNSTILNNGQSVVLTATVSPDNATNKDLSFTSSNPSVATVDNTGVVTAISAGTATITVTTIGDGKTATCSITVHQLVESVSIPVQTLSLQVGATYSLTGTVNPASAYNTALSYASSNPSVVSIDNTGKVTAISAGTAIITVQSVDGDKKATCTITVSQQATETVPTSWDNVNSIAERTTGNVNVLKVYNNQTTLYLYVKGSNLNTKNQFYIDTDNNFTTGFKAVWNNSGIEYLVEDGILYKYSGLGNRWKWTKICDVSISLSNNIVGISLPLSKLSLSLNNTIHIGFMSNDNRDSVLPIKTLPVAPYTIGNGTSTMNF